MLKADYNKKQSARAGSYVQQSAGYRAFIPAPLPPNPPIQLEGRMQDFMVVNSSDLLAEIINFDKEQYTWHEPI